MTINHERERRFLVNNNVAAAGSVTATAQNLMFGFVTAMLGTGTFVNKDGTTASWSKPLTCKGSSNSVAAGMDNVNRWASGTNLVWAGGASAHSWIVLESDYGWQLLIDLNNAAASSARIAYSASAGFTGGSTTARPTATDEQIVTTTAWGSTTSNNVANQWHLIVSNDGKDVILVITRNEWATAIWHVGVAEDLTHGTWTTPVYMYLVGSATGLPVSTALTYAGPWAAGGVFSQQGSTAMTLQLTTLYAAAGRVGQSTIWEDNDLSSEWPLYPIGLMSATTALEGFHGRIPDVYGGPFQPGGATPDEGCWYGATSGDEEWMQFGAWVVPWPKAAGNWGGTPAYFGPPYVATAVSQGTPVVYVMIASDSVTDAPYTWVSSGTPDYAGAGYPGPNSATNVAVAYTL